MSFTPEIGSSRSKGLVLTYNKLYKRDDTESEILFKVYRIPVVDR